VRCAESYFKQLEESREQDHFFASHRLKILVVKPVYGGSLPTANFCVAAFQAMGHQVEVVESDQFASGYTTLRSAGNGVNSLNKSFMDLMGDLTYCQSAQFEPDLILALAQAPLNPRAIQKLRSLNIPVAFWFVEDCRTFSYWKEIASEYDCFFTLQSGEFLVELRNLGAVNPYYLPQACAPESHRPLILNEEDRNRSKADLSFMGAGHYNRAQSFPRLLDYDFKIWGTEWNLESPVGSRVQNNNERVGTNETVKIYNAARINLNLHSSKYHEAVNPFGDFVNPRTFEIAACSGFQLVDHRSEPADLFRPGKEIITFDSIDDLREKIDYYLDHAEERERIAAAGYSRVMREHTMEQRMRELLLVVFQNRFDDLKSRVLGRENQVEKWVQYAGDKTPLGRYLQKYNNEQEVSLPRVVREIQSGEGALDATETLVLMVDQFFK